MKVSELISELQKIVQENPDAADFTVACVDCTFFHCMHVEANAIKFGGFEEELGFDEDAKTNSIIICEINTENNESN